MPPNTAVPRDCRISAPAPVANTSGGDAEDQGRVLRRQSDQDDETDPLKLPSSIKAAAARLAKEDGVSLNQWIASAIAQKVGAVEAAADFFRTRAEEARPEDLHAILALARDRAPDAGDELPPSGPR